MCRPDSKPEENGYVIHYKDFKLHPNADDPEKYKEYLPDELRHFHIQTITDGTFRFATLIQIESKSLS